MWKFLTRVLGGSDTSQARIDESGDNRVSSMLEAIAEGASHSALPTLVCRNCGLKYNNTGTYLSGSTCPDCAEAIDAKPSELH
jgi:predicted Zn-ribbon and HTH transcriptional regulator